MDRNMMLTLDEYMALRRLIDSERESSASRLADARLTGDVLRNTEARKRKTSPYQRRYKANFKKIAPRFKLKNGRWKKNGFKMAVRQAHKMSKK